MVFSPKQEGPSLRREPRLFTADLDNVEAEITTLDGDTYTLKFSGDQAPQATNPNGIVEIDGHPTLRSGFSRLQGCLHEAAKSGVLYLSNEILPWHRIRKVVVTSRETYRVEFRWRRYEFIDRWENERK